LGRKRYASFARVAEPRITFVGLWDTVAAYGLPIDELTRGWDQWVWPLSMRDRALSTRVDKACHVLALDDERNTFHPLLWTEAGQLAVERIDDERITQVWFAGMHSNVGGGYPDDSLAHVSLLWMGQQAALRGLRINVSAVNRWRDTANVHGPIMDSRHGLGGYYRYKPRSIAALGADARHRVDVARPKIHESVLRRVAHGVDGYAPTGLPAVYDVVTSNGAFAIASVSSFRRGLERGVTATTPAIR
jgi:hypothetical protein